MGVEGGQITSGILDDICVKYNTTDGFLHYFLGRFKAMNPNPQKLLITLEPLSNLARSEFLDIPAGPDEPAMQEGSLVGSGPHGNRRRKADFEWKVSSQLNSSSLGIHLLSSHGREVSSSPKDMAPGVRSAPGWKLTI